MNNVAPNRELGPKEARRTGWPRTVTAAIAGLLALMLAVPMALAAARAQAPAPFGTYIVYSAAGVYDPTVPPVQGNLADWFHREVMGRDDAAIAAERARADAYFAAEFGSLYTPGSLAAFGQDPRTQYRAYFISGEDVPPEGWLVRDGGFRAMLSDGGMVVFGNYSIDVTEKKKSEPIIIHYESADPIYPQADGSLLFRCRVTSEDFDDFGGGLAQGISDPQQLADGRTLTNIRNVLTFPGYGFAATQ